MIDKVTMQRSGVPVAVAPPRSLIIQLGKSAADLQVWGRSLHSMRSCEPTRTTSHDCDVC